TSPKRIVRILAPSPGRVAEPVVLAAGRIGWRDGRPDRVLPAQGALRERPLRRRLVQGGAARPARARGSERRREDHAAACAGGAGLPRRRGPPIPKKHPPRLPP